MIEKGTIGIIGGAGWLGQAFAEALVAAGYEAERLTLSYRSKRLDTLSNAHWTNDNQVLVDRSDVIIVSVRPQDFRATESVTEGKLVVSVMAGVTLEQLASRFRTDRVVRTLPNAAAEVRKSYTPWIASKGVTENDRRTVHAILDAVGSSDEMKAEADIDYLTGLTGSGPAFPALLAAAMMEDAVAHGLERDIARRCVNAVLVGTGGLVELRADDPSALVQTFIDYQGTTAAAILAMRGAGFDAAVARGLDAALRKSVAMGQPVSDQSEASDHAEDTVAEDPLLMLRRE